MKDSQIQPKKANSEDSKLYKYFIINIFHQTLLKFVSDFYTY